MTTEIYTSTSWISYGILSGFSTTTLYNLADVYEVRIVKLVKSNQGLGVSRIDYRVEGEKEKLERFFDALQSLQY